MHRSKCTPENIIVPVRGVWFCSSIAVPAISVSDADVHRSRNSSQISEIEEFLNTKLKVHITGYILTAFLAVLIGIIAVKVHELHIVKAALQNPIS